MEKIDAFYKRFASAPKAAYRATKAIVDYMRDLVEGATLVCDETYDDEDLFPIQFRIETRKLSFAFYVAPDGTFEIFCNNRFLGYELDDVGVKMLLDPLY